MDMEKREVPGMFEGPILPLVIRMSVPMFIGMFVQFIYNITDTIWVSRIDLDDPAILGGVGLVFPIIFFAIALSNGLMVGVSSLVARAIGEKNHKVLHKTAESGLVIGLVLAVFIIVFTYTGGRFFINAIGGNEEASYADFAWQYLSYIIPAALPMFIGQVFYGILQGEGQMKYVMIGMMIGTILNIILDPVFIFVFGMGVRGAALATALSHTISVIYVIIIFLTGIPTVRVKWSARNIDGSTIREIVRIGFPQALAQVIMSVSFVVFNRIIIGLDPKAMTALTLCGRLDQAVLTPSFAIGTAIVTIVGQNIGRGNLERARKAWLNSIAFGVFLIIILATVYIFVAPWVFGFLNRDLEVISYAVRQTRVLAYSFTFACIGIVGRSVFQAIGHPWPSIWITLFRLIVFALPAVAFFVYILGLDVPGVWYGIFVGNGLSAVVGIIWCLSAFKRLKSGDLKFISTQKA